MTQSAASAAIAALETGLGTRLFDRVGRGIALTEAGRVLLPEAKAVLTRAKAAEKTLIDLAALTRGSLALAASQTVANYWLPPVLQALPLPISRRDHRSRHRQYRRRGGGASVTAPRRSA